MQFGMLWVKAICDAPSVGVLRTIQYSITLVRALYRVSHID